MVKLRDYPMQLLYEHTTRQDNIIKLKDRKEIDKASILSNSMFKAIIDNEERIHYSCKLLSYFIDVNYEDLLSRMVLTKNELDKEIKEDKGCSSDFVADIDGTKINIEINNNESKETMHRNIEYAQRLYHKKSLEGNKYDHTQVVQININNFSFKGIDNIIDVYTIKNDEGISLTDKFIIIQIYIPNLIKKSYNIPKKDLNELERYLLVLVLDDSKKSLSLAKGDEIMKDFVEESIKVTGDKSFGVSYDHELADQEQRYRVGYREGLEAGIEQSKREIAMNMYSNGIAKELICKSLNINEKQLNEYIK